MAASHIAPAQYESTACDLTFSGSIAVDDGPGVGDRPGAPAGARTRRDDIGL